MRGIVVSALLLVAVVASANAGTRTLGARLGGGVSGTSGDVRETANVGVHGELGVRLTPAPTTSPELEVLLLGGFYSFTSSRSTAPDLQFLTVGAELRLNVQAQSPSHLYIIGGGGFARVTRKPFHVERQATNGTIVIHPVPQRTENSPYLTAGAGIVVVSRPSMRLYVELRAVNVFGTLVKNYTFIPLTVGIGF